MVTHLSSDILEYEVKWVLGSFTTSKANGGDRIPAELLQILKGNAIKVLYSIRGQIWKTQQWPQDWRRSSFHSNPTERKCQRRFNYHTITLISYVSKVKVTQLCHTLCNPWTTQSMKISRLAYWSR